MEKENRQDICRECFKFECYCQRCFEDWPPYSSIPNGISARNILNPSMADTVIKECKAFEEFMENVSLEDCRLHLNYIYSFITLLFTNVKRPFALYDQCVNLIIHGHTNLKHTILF